MISASVIIIQEKMNTLTRSVVLQWIDYIDVGNNDPDDSESRNYVTVHYKEPDKQKRREKNSYGFYRW